jgi:CHAT domain-containing protein/Tfp pilus assembly protein PilF
MVRWSWVAGLIALAVLAGGVRPRAQAPKPDAELIQRLASATTDEARTSILAAHPELRQPESIRALTMLANEFVRVRDFVPGEKAYESLLWLGQTVKDDRAIGQAHDGLGSVTGQFGKFLVARSHLETALRILAPFNEPALVQPVYSKLGIVFRNLGDEPAALAAFDQALTIGEQLGKPDMVARVYNNLGILYLNQGNATLAHDYFTRSLALKKDDGAAGTLEIAATLNNFGALYEDIGDVDQAVSYFTRALAMQQKVTGGPGTARTLSNLGHAYNELGDPARALEMYEKAIPVAVASREGPTMASLLQNLGNLAADAGDLKKAEQYHRESLAMREGNATVASVAESLAELAGVLVLQDQFTEAEALATRAVRLAEGAGLLGQVARAQMYLGQVYEGQGRTSDALAAYETAMAAVEALRVATPGGERTRQVFLSLRLGPYNRIAALHAKAGRGWDSLVAIEQARARTLLDILEGGRQPKRAMTDAERLVDRQLSEAALAASTQLMLERGSSTPDPDRLRARETQARETRAAHAAFTSALYAAKPDLRLVRGDAPIVTRADAAAIVAPGTAVVELVVMANSVWVYLIKSDPDGPVVSVQKLARGAKEVIAIADKFSTQVARRDLAFAGSSTQLYAALLGQFDAQLSDVSHLIVVPDSALWRVPFQALQTPRGKFLIEERAVSYAPSLSAAAALRARKVSRATREPFLLALGNPTVPEPAVTLVRGAAGPLPEAAREVRALGRLYGAQRSSVFTDAAATEAAFRAGLKNASVVHIATHGVLDDISPMNSHLKLAGSKDPASVGSVGTKTETDGRLEAWELLDLELTADLAVLSACETASGKLGGGEGVIGLSWALFAAGASTAVVSQWEVDSASTTALMIGFHERLLAPASPAPPHEALRRSAMSVMKDPRYRHPFYWAGFIVVGS